MKAIQIDRFGPASLLQLADVPEPALADPTSVLIGVHHAGVNFVDIYQREGRYPGLSLPFIPGIEATGTVLAAGSCSGWAPGARVGFAGHRGAYAEQIVVPGGQLVEIPAAVSFVEAAILLEQGLTAHFLIHDVFRAGPAHTVVVHAAAGGVGMLLVQLARRSGARVIALVSSAWKAERVRALGASEVLLTDTSDWPARVRALVPDGAHAVYDSVGRDTFDASLSLLAPRGHLILFGAASGQVPPVDILALMKRSLTLTRPVLPHYLGTRKILQARAADLFAWQASGELRTHLHATFPLAAAAEAHRLLESRATHGKLLLEVRA